MAQPDLLPPVRSELRLAGRRHDVSGHEVCVVYDPVRHRFFELSPLAVDMLSRWQLGSRTRLIEAMAAAGTPIAAEDVAELVEFLFQNGLLRIPVRPRMPGFWGRVEHAIGQLFFVRIPLVRPDRLLTRLCESSGPLFGRTALRAMAIMAALGLGLVARQWDLFLGGFRSAFNTEGLVSFTLAVVLAKAIHELGHAIAAKRMGCAVPAMGVAVMFGAPLLYTDLSDSWRLSRRRQRLIVAAGGILAETGLAALATWGWLILPEGPARGACFFLMTAAWVATLAVNINPFMRFDGYFMLSDLMGVPNLQPRSFALGRWMVRRLLFDSPEPAPEEVGPALRRAMVAYAWTTWFVRAGIYLGLAFAVFHVLPKVAAVPLLASELWVLVARPVVHELRTWWRMRQVFAESPRARAPLWIGVAVASFAMVPQSFSLALPAVLAPAERLWVHAPRPSRLVMRVEDGAAVHKGDVVAVFLDPELDHQLAEARIRVAMAQAQHEQAATNQRSARDLAVAAERLAREQSALLGVENQRAALTITAPFDGMVTEFARDLAQGSWRSPAEPLFLVVADGPRSVTALVDDRELALVATTGAATFFANAPDFPVLETTIQKVEAVPVEAVNEPLLASVNGGPIAADKDSSGRIVPRQGQYTVSAAATANALPPSEGTVAGKLMVQTRPHSLIGLAIQRIWALVVRETSA